MMCALRRRDGATASPVAHTQMGENPDNPLGRRGSLREGVGTATARQRKPYDDAWTDAPIGGTVTKISAVIPDDVAALLEERAETENRSVGAVIRSAVAEHVAANPQNDQFTTCRFDPGTWVRSRNRPVSLRSRTVIGSASIVPGGRSSSVPQRGNTDADRPCHLGRLAIDVP